MVVSEDWKSAVIVPLYKGRGEMTEYSNYRGISSLSMVRKIYAGILVDRVCKVTEGLIDDNKAQEKNCKVYVGVMELEKPYDRVNREAL